MKKNTHATDLISAMIWMLCDKLIIIHFVPLIIWLRLYDNSVDVKVFLSMEKALQE